MRVGKTNSFDDDFTVAVDDSGLVKAFGNINAENVHTKHSFGHLL